MASIVRKGFINKKTKQVSVTIPKKAMKKLDSSLKFGENIWIRLEVLKKKKNGRN